MDTEPEQLSGSARALAKWQDSAVFHAPHCEYDSRAASVDRDLAAMRKSGQQKLALVIWYAHWDEPADCRGYLANAAGGHLSPRVLHNLEGIVAAAKALGYREVQVRFAAQDGSEPVSWGADWNEARFNENWRVVESTVRALSRIRGLRVVYDLDVELGGTDCLQCHAYIQRMWKAFTTEFPPSRSYGYSIAMAKSRIGKLLEDLRRAGPLPKELALDVYHSDAPSLKCAADEMKAEGVKLPVLIQETTYSDPAMYRSLIEQARRDHVRTRTVMQWPLRPGNKLQISEKATPDFIYRPVR